MTQRRKISPGDVYENLEMLENLGYRKIWKKNLTFWKCRCLKCGKIIEIPQLYIGTVKKDCGCWRTGPKIEMPVGTQYGRLTIISDETIKKHGEYCYLCECSCEKHTVLYVRGGLLRNGDVRSCGCLHDELFQDNSKKDKKINYVNNTSRSKVMTDGIQKNNTSGYRGVSWHNGTKKWVARITYKKKTYSLGYYDDPAEASRVVEEARKKIKEDCIGWYKENMPEEYEKYQKRKANS